MTGSIDKYKIKGSSKPHWRYRISIGKAASGARQYASESGFEKQADAADAMHRRLEEMRRAAGQPAPSSETLGEHLRQWLEQHAPQRCSPKTLERYNQLAKYVLIDADSESALAKTVLRELTAAQLETALYDLMRRPAARRKHLSAKTICHVAGLLNTALNKAFRLGKIDFNPLMRVELPVIVKNDARGLSPDEIEAILNACLNDWTHSFVQVGLATGCRRGELLALEWSDVNLATGTIIVSKSLEQTKALGLRVKRPKNGKQRTFQLPQSAITALRFQAESQKDHRRLFGADYVNLNLVFCRTDGSYLDPALVSQTIVRRMQKAGIANASLHTLRHAHTSGLLSERVPLTVVSARLGHANTNITASIYAHAMPADDQQAADKWDEFLKRKPQ